MMAEERELAAACARGDQGAWLELVRRYGRGVGEALRRAGAREEADDLRQEVWARLLARDAVALRGFRAQNAGALRAFLARVARSVAIDHGRSQRLRFAAAPEDEPQDLAHQGPGPDALLAAERWRARLSAALDSAAAQGARPGRDRDVLRLHFEEGHTPAEIASTGVGLSPRGVEALLRRARGRLEQLLREEEP